jgi:hypothetical protein
VSEAKEVVELGNSTLEVRHGVLVVTAVLPLPLVLGLDELEFVTGWVIDPPVDSEPLVTTLPVYDVVLLANGGVAVELSMIVVDGKGPVENDPGPLPVLWKLDVTVSGTREVVGAVPVLTLWEETGAVPEPGIVLLMSAQEVLLP